MVAGFLLVGQASAAALSCTGPITLPPPATTTIQYGDALSYSLNLLGYDVRSQPGDINDCVVILTGASGNPVNQNFTGMDDAYHAPSGSGGPVYFKTGDPTSSPDPGSSFPAFLGQTATTWDATLASLRAFTGINDLIVYFNLNQENSGGATNQNLFIWAQIELVDTAAVNPLVSKFFDFVSTPCAPFGTNGGCPGGDPTSYNSPGAYSPSLNQMVQADGKVCLGGTGAIGSPIVPCDGSGGAVARVINNNLGADQAAFAVFFPELQAYLNMANFGGYDMLRVSIQYGCLPGTVGAAVGQACPAGSIQNNGYEQMFLGTALPVRVPEPSTIALFGLGLLVMTWGVRRRSVRS